MAVLPPLRGELVLNPDGTVTQKFAEYLEKLEETIGLDEEIEESSGTFLGLFAQNAALGKRIDELEQRPVQNVSAILKRLEDLEPQPIRSLGDIMKRLEDLEQQQ